MSWLALWFVAVGAVDLLRRAAVRGASRAGACSRSPAARWRRCASSALVGRLWRALLLAGGALLRW